MGGSTARSVGALEKERIDVYKPSLLTRENSVQAAALKNELVLHVILPPRSNGHAGLTKDAQHVPSLSNNAEHHPSWTPETSGPPNRSNGNHHRRRPLFHG